MLLRGRAGEGKEQASPQCGHSVPGRSPRRASLGEGHRERSQPQRAVGAGRWRLSRQRRQTGRTEPRFSWFLSLGRARALPSFLPSLSGSSFSVDLGQKPLPPLFFPTVNDYLFPSFFFSEVSSWVRVEGHPGRRFWKPHPEATRQNKTETQGWICIPPAKPAGAFPEAQAQLGSLRVGFLQKSLGPRGSGGSRGHRGGGLL